MVTIEGMTNDTKFCPRCEETKPIGEFYRNTGRYDGLSGYCVLCQRISEDERKTRARLKIIADLGGKCSNPECAVPGGMRDPRALQIDHVNGDGTLERIEFPNSATAKFYAKVRSEPDRYALLCANCNWIKRAEKNECIGKRVYERTEPTEKQDFPGRNNAAANQRRSESAKRWAEDHADEIAQRAQEVSKKITGRKLVMGDDGKKHWVYPER